MELSSTVPETAWQDGRFDASRGRRKLLFGLMYEDAAIELGAFYPGGRVFCIGSAGCTAMKLARQHEVVAVDINPVQVAYLQRRISGGPVERGSAERILAFMRVLGHLAGWNRQTVRTFLDLDDPGAQISYWRSYLDTRLFRAGLDFLFSRRVLRSIYSASFLDCLPPNFGAVMRDRMARCFALHSNRENVYARTLLLGEFPSAPADPDVRQIQLVCADAIAFLESQPAGSFTGFSLSNILDGTNLAYERRLFAAVQRAAAPGAIVVRRSFGEPQFSTQANRAAEDRAMLWGIVDIRAAVAL